MPQVTPTMDKNFGLVTLWTKKNDVLSENVKTARIALGRTAAINARAVRPVW